MSSKEAGVDATRTLCSSGEMNLGRASTETTAGAILDFGCWCKTRRRAEQGTADHIDASHVDIRASSESGRRAPLRTSVHPLARTLREPIQTMARPTDPRSAALLDHVFTQTLGNINFLASQNYIPAADAAELASRLTNAQHRDVNGTDSLASSMQALQVAPVPPPLRRNAPPPTQKKQARAIWAYNEDGRVGCRPTSSCHVFTVWNRRKQTTSRSHLEKSLRSSTRPMQTGGLVSVGASRASSHLTTLR